ncbi:MAG: endonuclease MutS2, partial [Nitrospirae bacterium]
MGLTDPHTLRVLEFEKILNLASRYAITSPGREAVKRIVPLGDRQEINRRVEFVSEFRRLREEGREHGLEHFEDMEPLFTKAAPEGAVLDPLELRSLLPLFYSTINIRNFSDIKEYPHLSGLGQSLSNQGDLLDEIERSIDREGYITDEASLELHRIRRHKRSVQGRIKRHLEGILRRKDLAPHLQDFFITERNGRFVIPLKRDSKGRVPGIIHDISNTGETIFVEPYEVQSLGNELESLRAEEKVEELRILRLLTAEVRKKLPEIRRDYELLTEADTFQAVASFSDELAMEPPLIHEGMRLRIVGGKHPLLYVTLKNQGREDQYVPLDIEIGGDYRVMVITGSNAGGKTVALKTTGVIVLMALSGMHIPAKSTTEIPLLGRVLADIGDEQSIEANLSTFSAHIIRLGEIMRQSDRETLVLIDELGTGTDPEEGGALSAAILKHLYKKGALTLVTTHLGLLKGFAHSEEGMTNAAMEMERVDGDGRYSYRPTYRLRTGVPGRSHAFEIARNLGLPDEIIREAEEISGGAERKLESLIGELEQKRLEFSSKLLMQNEKLKDIDKLRSDLERERKELRSKRKEIIDKARKEATEFLRVKKREAEEIIRRLKKAGSAEEARPVKTDLEKLSKAIPKVEEPPPQRPVPIEEIKKGMAVSVPHLGIRGVVEDLNLKTGRCRLFVDGRELEIDAHLL